MSEPFLSFFFFNEVLQISFQSSTLNVRFFPIALQSDVHVLQGLLNGGIFHNQGPMLMFYHNFARISAGCSFLSLSISCAICQMWYVQYLGNIFAWFVKAVVSQMGKNLKRSLPQLGKSDN